MPATVERSHDLVADTNVLLANLSLLQEAVQVIGEWQERSPLHFLIPFVVIRELDGLKHSSRSNEDSGSADNTAFVARQATNWLLSVLKTHPTAIQMQGKHEVTDELLTRRDVPVNIPIVASSQTTGLSSQHRMTIL